MQRPFVMLLIAAAIVSSVSTALGTSSDCQRVLPKVQCDSYAAVRCTLKSEAPPDCRIRGDIAGVLNLQTPLARR